MCRVLNKHGAGRHEGPIYIGRGSKWGNPFRIGVDGDRAAVIAKQARWLRDQHHLLRALDELRGKNLLCFCAPAACHGDLLLRLANATRQTHRVVALGGMIVARSRRPARADRRRSRERLAAPVAEVLAQA